MVPSNGGNEGHEDMKSGFQLSLLIPYLHSLCP